MDIVIHGATHSSNFGDVLFAYLFYNACKNSGCKVELLNMPKFKVSDFCKNELQYNVNGRFIRQLRMDCLIMMSGGYLGEDMVSFKNSLKRYLHYILPARLFEIMHKPVYIIGVGGGPLTSNFLRRATVKMLNRASYVSVRDIETKKYFEEYGVTKEVCLTTDTAQVIDSKFVACHAGSDSLNGLDKNKKYFFFHVVNKPADDARMASTVALAINHFLKDHAEYDVIIGNDEQTDITRLEAYKTVIDGRKHVFEYRSVFQLCHLLGEMQFVITPKLHVGIVSASLGKSVVSFPIHREKTGRYYKQIGESERSVHMQSVTEQIAFDQIEKYYDKPIRLDGDIRKLAEYNIDFAQSVAKLIDSSERK